MEVYEAGMVYCDLKSDNVFLISEYGCKDFVCVLDFGIVKVLEDSNLLYLMVIGSMVGMLFYMSFEVGSGKVVSAVSDLYFFGVLFFEVLSGQFFFMLDNVVWFMV